MTKEEFIIDLTKLISGRVIVKATVNNPGVMPDEHYHLDGVLTNITYDKDGGVSFNIKIDCGEENNG